MGGGNRQTGVLTHPIGKGCEPLLDVGKDDVGVLVAVDGDIVGKMGKNRSGNSGIGGETAADDIGSVIGASGEGVEQSSQAPSRRGGSWRRL